MTGAPDFSIAFSTAYTAAPTVVGGNGTLLEYFKDYLGIPLTDQSRDKQLTQYLGMAGAAAEKYIDNIIVSRPVTERFRNQVTPIPLRFYPVDETVPAKATLNHVIVKSPWGLYIQDGIGWATAHQNGYQKKEQLPFDQLDLTYTAGYDPIPADLSMAIIFAATALENQFGSGSISVSGGGAVKRESIVGVGSVEYDTGGTSGGVSAGGGVGLLPEQSVAILDQYRRLWA